MPVLIHTVLATTLLGSIATAQAPKKAARQEQTEFGSEDENWDQPVSVPVEVLRILREANHASADEIPAESLLASEIHLRDANEVDLILMGIGNLRLAHAALFWIFRNVNGEFELILSTGGDSLRVLDAKSNGYRKIGIEGNTASTTTLTIYTFDGRAYRLSKKATKRIE
jgi:hypothetical protein